MITPILSILAAASLAAGAPTVNIHKTNLETPLQTEQESYTHPDPTEYRGQAKQFRTGYNADYVHLYTAAGEAV